MLRRSLIAVSALAVASALATTADAQAVGGSGGSPFSIQCAADQRLVSVTLRSGKRIDQIGIRCEGGGRVTVRRVGSSGDVQHRFLDPGEEITEVRGWAGKCKKKKSPRICALRFAASDGVGGPLRLSPQYGEYHSKADDFTLKVPAGRELYGFTGRAGAELDALDLLTRPRDEGENRRSLDVRPMVQALNVALGGARLRLNNRGERHGNSWHRANDSWFSLFGATYRFSLEEQSIRRKNGIHRHFFYANDINATKADVTTEANAFVLRVNFEEAGKEIKGLCRRKKANGDYASCGGRNEGDGNTPDLDWIHPRLDVTLLPVARGGELVLSTSTVHIRGDLRMNGICGSGNECKGLLGDWETEVRTKVEAKLGEILAQPDVLAAQAKVTRPILTGYGVSAKLKTAGLSGDQLVVTW